MTDVALIAKLSAAYAELMPALIRLALKVGEDDPDMVRAARAADTLNDVLSAMREKSAGH